MHDVHMYHLPRACAVGTGRHTEETQRFTHIPRYQAASDSIRTMCPYSGNVPSLLINWAFYKA